MVSLLLAILLSLAAEFCTRRHLVLEILASRHPPLVLTRTITPPALCNSDPTQALKIQFFYQACTGNPAFPDLFFDLKNVLLRS
jgi:hypothetical protein